MKPYDVIAIGELNVDLLLNRIDGFPEIGKEKFAGDMLLTLGSSTAIFAANSAALGVRTGFAGMIGRDTFGELVKRSLRDKGVDTRFVIESDACATGATIVMNYGEDRANLTYQGARTGCVSPMSTRSFSPSRGTSTSRRSSCRAD